MAIITLKELRDNIATTTRETQIDTLIDQFINLTLQEINEFSPWTGLRRKTTFDTVASQEDYDLDEEVDRITLLRQTDTPTKLIYMPDHIFYRRRPNPEDVSTGQPRIYRLWEETGFSAQNTSAETLDVASASTADTTQTVVIVGRESTNNKIVSEVITLNGTTTVTSSNTYAVGGLMRVSKSGATTGAITVSGNSSSTTFSILAPEERAPRFKRISLYPIPSSVITMRLEYLERLRLLVNDADVPQLDHKWNWVLREGVLAKVWEYKGNEQATTLHLRMFRDGLDEMKAQDQTNLDYVPVMQPRFHYSHPVRRVSDSVNNNFPAYSVGSYGGFF